MDKKNPHIHPFTYILIGVVIVLAFKYLFLNNQTQSLSSIFQQSKPTINPYKDCISWQETEYHDGEEVCIIGKVIIVDLDIDEWGNKIWKARFSLEGNSFQLVSVGSSLDEWKNMCVVIRGTLKDRSLQEPDFTYGPWMINNEFGDDYSIRKAPVGLCQ